MGGQFVVCEGLDKSGKTTSMKYALEYLRNEDYPTIYNKGLKTNTLAGRFSKLFPSTSSLLLELGYLDITRIKPSLRKGEIILQDRWYYSVLSHNSYNKIDNFLEKTFVPYLSKPDILIYFTVSDDERIKRLENSDNTIDHRILIENPEIIHRREKRYEEYYREFHGYKAILDTTYTPAEETGYEIYELIKTYKLL